MDKGITLAQFQFGTKSLSSCLDKAEECYYNILIVYNYSIMLQDVRQAIERTN